MRKQKAVAQAASFALCLAGLAVGGTLPMAHAEGTSNPLSVKSTITGDANGNGKIDAGDKTTTVVDFSAESSSMTFYPAVSDDKTVTISENSFSCVSGGDTYIPDASGLVTVTGLTAGSSTVECTYVDSYPKVPSANTITLSFPYLLPSGEESDVAKATNPVNMDNTTAKVDLSHKRRPGGDRPGTTITENLSVTNGGNADEYVNVSGIDPASSGTPTCRIADVQTSNVVPCDSPIKLGPGQVLTYSFPHVLGNTEYTQNATVNLMADATSGTILSSYPVSDAVTIHKTDDVDSVVVNAANVTYDNGLMTWNIVTQYNPTTIKTLNFSDPLVDAAGGTILCPKPVDSITIGGDAQVDSNAGAPKRQAGIGTITCTATVPVTKAMADGNGNLVNSVTVTSDTGVSKTGSKTSSIRTLGVDVTKTFVTNDVNGNGRVDKGDTVTYTVTAKNAGDVSEVIRLSDAGMPAGATCTGGSPWSNRSTGGFKSGVISTQVEYNDERPDTGLSFNPGDSYVCTYTVPIDNCDQISSSATATAWSSYVPGTGNSGSSSLIYEPPTTSPAVTATDTATVPVACEASVPTPSDTPTPTPTPSASPTPSDTPTPTPTPSASPTPSDTPTPTPSASPTPSDTPTPAQIPSATSTPSDPAAPASPSDPETPTAPSSSTYPGLANTGGTNAEVIVGGILMATAGGALMAARKRR